MTSTDRALSAFNAKILQSFDAPPAGGEPAMPASSAGRFPRRDIVAILAYVNRERTSAKCVDGTFNDVCLARLAAAARMQ